MVDNWKIEYDQRQFRLMHDQLILFEKGKLDLASLIKGIKGLLSVLEEVDESWIDKIRREWGILETVYAVAVQRKEQNLAQDTQTTINDPVYRSLINEATQNMRQLVQDVLRT
jgi:hypothetical protein